MDLEVGDVETAHYLNEHRCEMVWNRKDRLKLITTDTVVRSKFLSGSQKPTRLANGAIAKGIIGGVGGSMKPQSLNNLNTTATPSSTILESGNNVTDHIEIASKPIDLPNVATVQASSSINQHPVASHVYPEIGCTPEKRRKPGEINVGRQKPASSGIGSGNSYIGNATIITSKIVPLHHDTQIKG